MPNEAYKEQVRRFIVENYLLGQADGLQETDSFLDTGIIDSTGVLQLIEFLQETYNIAISDEELTTDNLDSIRKVADYLDRKVRPVAAEELECELVGGGKS